MRIDTKIAKGPVSCAVVLATLLSVSAGQATAQSRAPNEEELHSMYCVEVLRAQITLQEHMISALSEAAGVTPSQSRQQWIDTSAELFRQLEKLQGALYRLQGYMLPRIPAIDSSALAAAVRQANAELPASWSNEALLRQMNACENPTWVAR
ncbi:MAG TPA: hypothetical protein VKT54_12545 [Steroidobacteraceae bacterium]|nr:hypothetical protein [Steroidobacteraceae bacterium]